MSRNARAHWYFSHLNTCVRVQNRVDLTQFTGDIEVVSVMPVEPVPADWDWDTSSLYQYKVGRYGTVDTRIQYLWYRYCWYGTYFLSTYRYR